MNPMQSEPTADMALLSRSSALLDARVHRIARSAESGAHYEHQPIARYQIREYSRQQYGERQRAKANGRQV
jgi:hypothetical protein